MGSFSLFSVVLIRSLPSVLPNPLSRATPPTSPPDRQPAGRNLFGQTSGWRWRHVCQCAESSLFGVISRFTVQFITEHIQLFFIQVPRAVGEPTMSPWFIHYFDFHDRRWVTLLTDESWQSKQILNPTTFININEISSKWRGCTDPSLRRQRGFFCFRWCSLQYRAGLLRVVEGPTFFFFFSPA